MSYKKEVTKNWKRIINSRFFAMPFSQLGDGHWRGNKLEMKFIRLGFLTF